MSELERFIDFVMNSLVPEAMTDRLHWCRIVLQEYHSFELPELDYIEWLIALDSETDHFPVAEQRDLCSTGLLARLDKELIMNYEEDLLELPDIRNKLIEELDKLKNE